MSCGNKIVSNCFNPAPTIRPLAATGKIAITIKAVHNPQYF